MIRKLLTMISAAIVALSCSGASAQEKLTLGRSSVAKIMCAVYAGKSKDTEQNVRANGLYLSGIQDLRDYLDAVESGEFTVKQIDGSTPMLVVMDFGWLSISRDFAAGKIVASIEREAVEDYSKYDDLGADNWGETRPVDLWSSEADDLYRKKNCEFLGTDHSITPRKLNPLRAE